MYWNAVVDITITKYNKNKKKFNRKTEGKGER